MNNFIKSTWIKIGVDVDPFFKVSNTMDTTLKATQIIGSSS